MINTYQVCLLSLVSDRALRDMFTYIGEKLLVEGYDWYFLKIGQKNNFKVFGKQLS